MEDGPPMFSQDFSCPDLLISHWIGFRVLDYHHLWSDFPDRSTSHTSALGLVPVRSPLLGESRLISFPPGTEMFQFPGLASTPYVFRCGYPASGMGFPIRTSPGKKPVCRLPEAYRRLLRPSSPLAA